MEIEINNQSLLLISEHAVYLPQTKTLWVADAQLGKMINPNTNTKWQANGLVDMDIHRLEAILKRFEVDKLVFIGHLFYSTYLNDREKPGQWLASLGIKEVCWVNGNEKDYEPIHYTKFNLAIHEGCYVDGDFVYVSEYRKGMEQEFIGKYIVSGTINPVVKNPARQNETDPIFYFGLSHAILPSFGRLKKLKMMEKPAENENFYVIAGEEITKY